MALAQEVIGADVQRQHNLKNLCRASITFNRKGLRTPDINTFLEKVIISLLARDQGLQGKGLKTDIWVRRAPFGKFAAD
jgi:hypothetical protein